MYSKWTLNLPILNQLCRLLEFCYIYNLRIHFNFVYICFLIYVLLTTSNVWGKRPPNTPLPFPGKLPTKFEGDESHNLGQLFVTPEMISK